MAWNITTEHAVPPIPAGEYAAIVIAVNEKSGPHGSMVKIEFQITSADEWAGRRVSGIANQKLSANTKLGAWIAALLGEVPEVGQHVTEEDILRRACTVVVRRTANAKDEVFSNVAEVRPAA